MTIIATIVTTLIIENQNSNSPNNFTVNKFKTSNMTTQISAGTHCGISNQYCT